uniref:Uncharacterized protein n=1 Tax=Opuntia streptacantha TaxID=393608 RepID=A0A7C9F422_OPUST
MELAQQCGKPVIAKGQSESAKNREARPNSEGRYEGGSHESLHKVDLLGSGKPGAPRKSQWKQTISRKRTSHPINGYWGRYVHLPEACSVHYPSQSVHLLLEF